MDSSTVQVLRRSLWPFSFVYAGVAGLRNFLFDAGIKPCRGVDVPVVSVGNLTVGGTGKTPLVVWMVERARALGRRPAVLARGYGRAAGAELNDEGELLRRRFPDLPQVQDPDRVRGARQLAARGDVDLILLDDGFQHRRLRRDLDIVCLDARSPFAGFRVLPAGDLRESARGIRRAGLVVVTRADALDRDAEAPGRLVAGVHRLAGRDDLPVHFAVHRPESVWWRESGSSTPPGSLAGRRVHLLSAIARPQAFAATVEALGAEVVRHHVFRDHHRHDPSQVAQLARDAAASGAILLTTEKDAVKLDAVDTAFGVLRIGMQFRGAEPTPGELGLASQSGAAVGRAADDDDEEDDDDDFDLRDA